MSKAYLRFWGVRGSHAAPFPTHLNVGGNTSCVEIRQDDHILLCDAGTGAIPFGQEILGQTKIRELMVILTHYHWDHVCGLPFFVPAFNPDWKVSFFGPGNDKSEITKHISSQMRAPYFPVGTESWLANINYLAPHNHGLQYGPISIKYGNVHHPGSTYGYRIAVNGKYVVYISDNECEANTQKETSALIKDADILIHDAQYTPEDYAKKRGWGHSNYIDTVNLSIDAGVRELYLYHHDPTYDDRAIGKIHEHALNIIKDRKSPMICHVAREGMRIEL